MARVPVMAAGGIVMRRGQPPLIAVVRQRKRNEWVLPKGKLDAGETPRAAARREVLKETGHDVAVHEFLGTLVHDSGGRSKVVHYWRMEAAAAQTHELMDDIRAVDWLPLDAAIKRLSRNYERVFLEHVGPLALGVFARRMKAEEQSKEEVAAKSAAAVAPKKRRVKAPNVVPQREPSEPVAEAPMPVSVTSEPAAIEGTVAGGISVETLAMSEQKIEPVQDIESAVSEPVELADEAEFISQPDGAEATSQAENVAPDHDTQKRKSLAQKVRDWLGRAA